MSRMGVRRTRGTALTVVALVVLAGCGDKSNNTTASTSPSPAASHSSTTSSQPSSSTPTPTPQTVTLPVYYVGDQPSGPRLFREFRSILVSGTTTDRITAALKAALSNLALDPDYRTDWPAGTSVTSVDQAGSAYALDLSNSGADLTARPPHVTPAQANLAIQQLLYTVQAVTQTQSPITLRIDGAPAQTVLGVQVPTVIQAQPPMKVEGTVWIIDPQDGDHVGATFTVKGRGAFFEATVPWQLLQSNTVVKQGVTMAKECCTLSPYSFTVRNVRPGDYVLRVYDADQSGVEGGRGESSDTKRITID